MKNSTLVFRSLGIIIFLAGLAHLFSFGVNVNDASPTSATKTDQGIEVVNPDKKLETEAPFREETDYLTDKWKVAYDTDEFKGAIIYNIKKEGKVFNAYTYKYEDENGYAEKAEGIKTLTITSFDGTQGKGIYTIEYEGEKYQIDCQIAMKDENTFTLSYDYHGYGDVETWKRQ